MQAVLQTGQSLGIVPGGIAEMLRTDAYSERVMLQSRKGFTRLALEERVPIVPVYVFGVSTLFSNFHLPFLERLSRWLRLSLVLPYGRFGLLVPRRDTLLYAIGQAIECPDVQGTPSAEQIDECHHKLLEKVEELYHFYKGCHGWSRRPLYIE